MSRRVRIDAPGAMHHIVIRGIEGKAIFKDDKWDIGDEGERLTQSPFHFKKETLKGSLKQIKHIVDSVF